MNRDPTGSEYISDRMETKLLALVKNYREAVERLILSAVREKVAEEASRAPPIPKKPGYLPPHPTIDTKMVQDLLPRIGEIEIEVPGRKIIEDEIPKAFEKGMDYGERQLQLYDAGIGLGIGPKDQKMIETLENGCFGYIKDIPQATEKKVMEIISQGVIKDRPFGEITRDIVRKVDGIGINRATMIARTETMRAVNTGVISRYERAGLTKYEWLSALDKNTCDFCRNADGKIYPDEVSERPPDDTHPNCRCTLIISKKSLGMEKGEPVNCHLIPTGPDGGYFRNVFPCGYGYIFR